MKADTSSTRRNFLHLSGMAAASLAFSPVLTACGSGSDYEAAADEARRPAGKSGNELHELHELVRLATLAPSGHNTQPWKFRLEAGRIQLYPDLTRRVPVVDPDDRELWISLGSALENLLLAAAHFGYQAETTYHLAGTPDDHIAVALHKTGPAPAGRSAPFEAIPLRQSTRAAPTTASRCRAPSCGSWRPPPPGPALRRCCSPARRPCSRCWNTSWPATSSS